MITFQRHFAFFEKEHTAQKGFKRRNFVGALPSPIAGHFGRDGSVALLFGSAGE